MAVAYYGSHISEHLVKSPEGYLFCYGVPINRTGTQVYTARELNLEGDPERPVTVYRLEEDVFAPSALASFEGKDVTRGHPSEMLNAQNQSGYSKGHLENVRRDGENTVADLIIKDPALISDIENGILREVSCGYDCVFVPHLDGYKQTKIIGNHVAVVPKGRAGHEVAIQDAALEAEKGRNNMKKFFNTILTAFGMAAKDASPDELDKMVEITATALDAEPAQKAPEAAPAEDESTKTTDVMVERAPKGDDLGSKLDRILEMLEAKSRGGEGERPLHDESDLDEMIEKLSGRKEGEAITIPAEETDACTGPARDAAVLLLKKVRPVVASIENKAERARVTDALLSAIKGNDMMQSIAKAAKDSAQANAQQTQKTTYEQVCLEAQNAYAARNPHKMTKEEK